MLRSLGNTGLIVSRLCFGTLTLGPLQKNFPPPVAADLVLQGVRLGINFVDTAELYETYDLLHPVLREAPDIVVSSRSYAVTAHEMELSIERARGRLDRDYIDIFGLHEIENAATLKGHAGALQFLASAKAKGQIRAVGVSTHTVAGVRAAAAEPLIDVIHPIVNQAGIGIQDGTVAEMIAALETAKEFGKGIYAMKILGGGHLSSHPVEAFKFINSLACVDSVAIGMQSIAEVKMNLAFLNGEEPLGELMNAVNSTSRQLRAASWCQKCGKCVVRCGFGALSISEEGLVIDEGRCLRCGYCASVCPEFCLKVY